METNNHGTKQASKEPATGTGGVTHNAAKKRGRRRAKVKTCFPQNECPNNLICIRLSK